MFISSSPCWDFAWVGTCAKRWEESGRSWERGENIIKIYFMEKVKLKIRDGSEVTCTDGSSRGPELNSQ